MIQDLYFPVEHPSDVQQFTWTKLKNSYRPHDAQWGRIRHIAFLTVARKATAKCGCRYPCLAVHFLWGTSVKGFGQVLSYCLSARKRGNQWKSERQDRTEERHIDMRHIWKMTTGNTPKSVLNWNRERMVWQKHGLKLYILWMTMRCTWIVKMDIRHLSKRKKLLRDSGKRNMRERPME